MKIQIARVKPLSAPLERWNDPNCSATDAGAIVCVSGCFPFHPGATGGLIEALTERQTVDAAESRTRLPKMASGKGVIVKCGS
jgi:hypothetical protein